MTAITNEQKEILQGIASEFSRLISEGKLTPPFERANLSGVIKSYEFNAIHRKMTFEDFVSSHKDLISRIENRFK